MRQPGLAASTVGAEHLLERGLVERETAIKRKSAVIVDNMCKLVEDPQIVAAFLPPLTITEEDCNWIATSFDEVIAASHKVPGAIWSLGKTLVDNAVRKTA